MIRRGRGVAVVVAPVFVNGVCIIREMARKGAYVVAVDTKPTAVGFRSRYVKEKIVLPSPDEAPGAFTQWLLSRKDLDGAIVIPTDDFFLREIAENHDKLSGRFRLAVSPGESTLVALDKSRGYEAARRAGVAVPRTWLLKRGDDLRATAAHVGFPAILRPEDSLAFHKDFGEKMFYLRSTGELAAQFRKACAAGHKMLLQEVIPGEDSNVAVCYAYCGDGGEIMSPIVALKSVIYPPRFGVSQAQIVAPRPEVEKGTKEVLREMGLKGTIVGAEWKYDRRDGVWKFLEVNARSMFAIAVAKLAGADIIDRLWRDKLGLQQPPQGPIKHGRRWVYIKNGLLLFRKHPEERKSIREYVKLCTPPIAFGFLELRDPRPFLYDIFPMLGRRFSRRVSSD